MWNLFEIYDHDVREWLICATHDCHGAIFQKRDSHRGTKILDYVAQLREWLSLFLAANMDMTASEIGHNMLLEQVCK